jgi:benzoyl-CoA reductase/2-hydroxyglutaryl-CoA dehydratase subunit BcrC/BadD/HgdB
MNFYEAEIIKCTKRIQKIEANPDPTKLKSNKMLYKLERDLNIGRLQAMKEGKPFIEGFTPPLMRTLGEPLALDICADRSTLDRSRFDTIRALGLPDYACDRTLVCVDMCMKKELPPPSLMISHNFCCDPLKLAYSTLGRLFNIPVGCLDIGFHPNNDNLRYITDQIREIIELAEKKVPGIKYDESKLMELQDIDRQAYVYLHDIYQLRKRVPCPIAGKDTFRLPIPPSYYCEPRKALEYFRVWRDEMQERADKGIGAVKEEKLRVLWAVSGPFYTDPFSLLEKRGVSIPWFQFDVALRWAGVKYPQYGDETEYGRKLSPLEEEARIMSTFSWGGLAQRWVEDTLFACQDLKCDAIINFRQVGCTATVGLGKILEDCAKKELNISTLHFDGRQLDPTYFDAAQVNTQLNLFVDSCLREKGLS